MYKLVCVGLVLFAALPVEAERYANCNSDVAVRKLMKRVSNAFPEARVEVSETGNSGREGCFVLERAFGGRTCGAAIRKHNAASLERLTTVQRDFACVVNLEAKVSRNGEVKIYSLRKKGNYGPPSREL